MHAVLLALTGVTGDAAGPAAAVAMAVTVALVAGRALVLAPPPRHRSADVVPRRPPAQHCTSLGTALRQRDPGAAGHVRGRAPGRAARA